MIHQPRTKQTTHTCRKTSDLKLTATKCTELHFSCAPIVVDSQPQDIFSVYHYVSYFLFLHVH
ncbi:hypothetical protein Hanom_Chr02g00124211 [Helianthus anomalus]